MDELQGFFPMSMDAEKLKLSHSFHCTKTIAKLSLQMEDMSSASYPYTLYVLFIRHAAISRVPTRHP